MGTGSDVSICRIGENELEVNGDLIVNGMRIKDVLNTIKNLEERLSKLEAV